jgi:glutamate dehydrogenase
MIDARAKQRIFADILKIAVRTYSRRLSKAQLADLRRFIRIFYAPSSAEDLKELGAATLLAIAHSMWAFAKQRPPRKPAVRVFNPTLAADGWRTSHTVIQMVNDDMPFLVDSVTGALTSSHGLRIHIMHHPLVFADRDAKGQRRRTVSGPREARHHGQTRLKESFIYAEIDAISDGIQLKALEKELREILHEIRLAVRDWRKMVDKADQTIAALADLAASSRRADLREAKEFMEWLKDNNFTFLGSRDYHFTSRGRTPKVRQVQHSGLGILRNPDRHVIRGPKGLMEGAPEIIDFLKRRAPLFVTKANAKSIVHRPVHMDYVGVKLYDKRGRAIGERQFVGLFTSQSYMKSPRQVPFLRKKIAWVRKRMPFEPASHGGKIITHILETFPRDELFLIDDRRLYDTVMGTLRLLERPRPKAFLRVDTFERYVSAIVYVPRESYHSGLREKIEKILCEAFNGEISRYYALLSEDVLARWHFIIRTKPGQLPKVNVAAINRRIRAAARPWIEGLRDALAASFSEEKGLDLFDKYHRVFSEAYKEAFEPRQAIWDIENLENFNPAHDASFEIFREPGDPPYGFRLKIYHAARQIALSECLPMLENLGLKVMAENAYELLGERSGFIHAFTLEARNGKPVDIVKAEPLVEPLLAQVWQGEVEDDGFNALALYADIPCQNIVILRAYAKYLRQLGLSLSQSYIESALVANPAVARRLVRLFYTLFEPGPASLESRRAAAKVLTRDIHGLLNKVTSLDHDRILRAYLGAISATVRTNFFATAYRACRLPTTMLEAASPNPALALKIRPSQLSEAPKPKPFAEIFVYSPRLEGVHLRGGPVARGGIRWSDRREDFRTEVLGLLKAQQVKNAVIVPVGAKGGFFPKRLPPAADRDANLAEGTACYRIFIRTLLSVTDNLKGGRAVPPDGVVAWDAGDPYLVVAADKGTSTFSDIANGIAAAEGFWLGDAFASGGSNGYDHKKMAITALGAWVSVARHFREMGVDLARDSISVIGIGDMSGDVFGNGMLLSKKLRLLAAFDHRHIFFDPDPDRSKSFRERARLFHKARSSWADYNPKLIAKGGGVFSRAVKSIRLSEAFRAFLKVEAKALTPDEVIHQILRAKADLLWFGGIGTFVKASNETHGEAGDRVNDTVRINGAELGVKVVAEGGNLGMTQKGRIEYAIAGGRCNTDFIDNSAGVDCSDKEVNIKILLAGATNGGRLRAGARHRLLKSMTREVTEIVLRDNYLQTQAISIAEADSLKKCEQHAGLIRVLEKEGRLERGLEKLPTDEQFSKIALKNRGLTRPDLAVLVSHTKLRLKDMLLQGEILDTPTLRPELERGFPARLHKRFAKALDAHPLKRELVATALSNELVNRAGLTFVTEIEEETGLSVDQIVSAYLVVREAFRLKDVWRGIDGLDNKVSAPLQTQMHGEVLAFLRRQAAWFLKNLKRPIAIETAIAKFRRGLEKILNKPQNVLGPLELETFHQIQAGYARTGVPHAIARRVAAFSVLGQGCDIVSVALTLKRREEDVGRAYFEVGRLLGFDWLRNAASALVEQNHWDYLAAKALTDDLADQQRELTRSILERNKALPGVKAIQAWIGDHPRTLRRATRLIGDLKASGQITIAKLSFAARHIRSIIPRNVKR